jgi:site-specific recombinase XerD
LHEFVQLKGLRPKTIANYQHWLKDLARHEQRADLPALQWQDISGYLLHLKNDRKLQPSTLNQARSALQALYRDYLKLDWDEHWQHVRFRQQRALPHVLTREEVSQLLSSFRESRYRALFTTAYQCGLRISEARCIAPKHINSQRKILHVRDGKGGKTREVPMTDELIDRLRAFYLAHRNPCWLFPSTVKEYRKNSPMPLAHAMRLGTTPISRSSASAAFRKVCQSSGLLASHEKISAHTLRHSYATHMLEAGVSVQQLASYLGHSTLESTMIYLHVTEISEQKGRIAIQTLAK